MNDPLGLNAVLMAITLYNDVTIYRNLDLDETGVLIKTGALRLLGYFIFNNASSTRYIKLYDIAVAPTVGTTVPVLTWPLPAGAAANEWLPGSIPFSLGLGIGATTGVADTNTGAPSANDVVVNIYYRAL